jgi:diguanylate cyclase (GGDEF)-like protein/PAS domain S-box-containing protein
MDNRNDDAPRSISRMLGLVLIFAAFSLSAIVFSSYTISRVLSGVRAYIGGEGLWSKAEKDGVFHLSSYAETHDELQYQKFLAALDVPLGDRVARTELERPHPRIEVAKGGFRQGRNHPDDLETLIWVFRRFRRVGYVERAIDIWGEGDIEVIRLRRLGIALHAETVEGRLSEDHRLRFLRQIDAINGRLTTLEDTFSFTLGEAARWARRILLVAMFGIAGVLMLATFLVSTHAARLLKKEDDDLRESNERYRSLVETATEAIISIDENSVILFANKATVKVFGYPIDQIVGRKLTMLMPDYLRSRHDASLARYVQSRERHLNWEAVEMPGLHRSGGEIALELSFGEVVTAGKSTFTGIIRDVTDRKRSERFQSALYRIAEITNAAEDLDSFYAELHRVIGELMYAKNFYIALSDETSGEIRFPYFVDEFDPPPPPLKAGQGLTGHILSTGKPFLLAESEIAEMTTGGKVEARGATAVDWLGVPLRTGDRILGVLAVQSYTERIRYGEREKELLVFVSRHIAVAIEKKRTEKQIERLAFRDALTGLANRISLDDRLNVALSNARRERHPLAVLFIDLDRFKVINDSLGHKIGDLLLQRVAERLSGMIRGSDTLSRLGGDEFILLLPKIDRAKSAGVVAQTIQQGFRRPFNVAERELFVTISTGISIFPEDGEDADTLVKRADAAMYVAKQRGRDNFQFYSHAGHQSGVDRLDLETQLHGAIERSEFRVYFQPVVRLIDGEVTGMEALVRWEHPYRGLLFPGDFIPLAEDSGLIFELGGFVLRESCRQALLWRKRWNRDLSVSVNLSVRQLQERGLVATVRRILEETGLPAEALSLEITESIAMQNLDVSLVMLGDLRSLGIGITMDDFGTGYSSLSYLKMLPVNTLKIDRSFIRDVATDPNDASIVRASVVMAHELRLRVVAEGVETAEQLRFLREHQCDDLQGFLYSPAVVPEEFESLIENRKRLPD